MSGLFKALPLVALAMLPLAARAASLPLDCEPAPHWDEFSSVALKVKVDGDPSDQVAVALTLRLYEHGLHLISELEGQRKEVVQLIVAPGDPVLASDPEAPTQLAVADMLLGVPKAATQRQSRGPCDLREHTRYPVDFRYASAAVSGELERDGNSVRLTLVEKRPKETVSYSGALVFTRPRGEVPTTLPVRGWTIFRDSHHQDRGEPSRFGTLGDFLQSLPAPAPDH